jgi:predicted GNAT superfamily acetyltransferase
VLPGQAAGESPSYTGRVTTASSGSSSVAVIRPFEPTDAASVTQVNNDAYPAVPTANVSEIIDLAELCDWTMVCEMDGEVVGFLFAVEPGKNYESENYRFFESRGLPHFYIDRIVLGASSRGQGLGKRLYREVFQEASSRGFGRVTCEVNLKPENPASLAFHEAMGFVPVGVQDTKGGAVQVQLLEVILQGATDG